MSNKNLINKLNNFLVYINSLKFKFYFTSRLRFLFERNLKITNFFESVSNVYRSSKWNNLKTFNVSNSFKNYKYLRIILIFIILIFLWMSFFFYIELINCLYAILLVFNNVFEFFFFLIFTFYVLLKYYFIKFFNYLLSFFYGTNFLNRIKSKKLLIKKNNKVVNFVNSFSVEKNIIYIYNTFFKKETEYLLKIYWYLQSLKLDLIKFNFANIIYEFKINDLIKNSFFIYQPLFKDYKYFIYSITLSNLVSKKKYQLKSNKFFLTSIEKFYYPANEHYYLYGLLLKDYKKIFYNKEFFQVISSNLNNFLFLSKSEKWVTKLNLFNNNIVIKNNFLLKQKNDKLVYVNNFFSKLNENFLKTDYKLTKDLIYTSFYSDFWLNKKLLNQNFLKNNNYIFEYSLNSKKFKYDYQLVNNLNSFLCLLNQKNTKNWLLFIYFMDYKLDIFSFHNLNINTYKYYFEFLNYSDFFLVNNFTNNNYYLNHYMGYNSFY